MHFLLLLFSLSSSVAVVNELMWNQTLNLSRIAEIRRPTVRFPNYYVRFISFQWCESHLSVRRSVYLMSKIAYSKPEHRAQIIIMIIIIIGTQWKLLLINLLLVIMFCQYDDSISSNKIIYVFAVWECVRQHITCMEAISKVLCVTLSCMLCSLFMHHIIH